MGHWRWESLKIMLEFLCFGTVVVVFVVVFCCVFFVIKCYLIVVSLVTHFMFGGFHYCGETCKPSVT